MFSRIVARAYADEIEKQAADVGVMLKRLSEAKGVKVGPSMVALQGGGAVSMANRGAMKPLLDHRLGKPERLADRMQQLGQRFGDKGAPLQGIGGGIKESLRIMRDATRAQAGQVRVDPDVTEATVRSLAGGKKLTGKARDAHTALVLGHEMAERRVKAREVAPLYSHISPKVLLEEHGMLSKATGPGAAEAVARLRAARRTTGEAEHMKNLATTSLRDPRAAQFFAEGEKVPKAMRKAILRKVQQDPTLLQRTKPGLGYHARQAVSDLSKLPERARAVVDANRTVLQKLREATLD
jgi:hypothetical protein